MPSDCLTALSGLVKANRELDCGYLAGMWRHSLRADLLWRVDTSTLANAARPSKYRAPSWVWPSVCAPIICWSTSFYDQTYRNAAGCWKIKSVDTSLTGSDPTGQVSGGILEVEGACLDGFVELKEDHSGESAVVEFLVLPNGGRESFFPDFKFSLNNGIPSNNVLLIRATPEIIVVLNLDYDSTLTYERIGISERNSFQMGSQRWAGESKILIR